MLAHLHSHLKPGGLWLLADFFITPSQPGWRKYWQTGLTQLMYTFFGWLCHLQTHTLPNLDVLFTSLPLQLTHTQYFYFQFIRSQVYRNVAFTEPDGNPDKFGAVGA
jgi:hypothetical protein